MQANRWLIPLAALAGLCSFKATASDAPLLPSQVDAKYRAIGQLRAASSCTATLVRGPLAPSSAAAAIVVTAGHCVDSGLRANETIVDRAANDAWRFTPAFFHDNTPEHRAFAIDRVLYATMKGVDVAVLRLKATYGELSRIGVHPLALVTYPRTRGTAVELVHVPVDGVPEDERFLRLSRCVADGPMPLFEGNAPWYWPHASRTDCAGVAGGSSGAPALLAGTANVVGTMGTRVDPAFTGCGLNRPCEIVEGPAVGREGASYIHPLADIVDAWDGQGGWDGSMLDHGDGATVERTVPWTTTSRTNDGAASARWGVRIGEGTRWIRYKTGPAVSLDCDVATGYGDVLDAAAQPLESLQVPSPEGVYAMCVLDRRDDGSAWQRPSHATRLLRQIDDTPPTAGPSIVLYAQSADAWLVYGNNRPYDVTSLQLKVGPRDTTDCHSPDGYFLPWRFWETLSFARAPWRVCARGWDDAGNPSPVTERVFER